MTSSPAPHRPAASSRSVDSQSAPSSGQPLGSYLRSEPLLFLAIAVGALLRLYQLGGQILADDEWHALHAGRDCGYAWIAVHFGSADYSIPLTLFYKAVADTIGLSELMMRAPILLCGLASLAILPWLVRQVTDRATATIFGWLLAISPIHVYYSRYARPYAISMLFAFVGLLGFYRFWTSGDRRGQRLYGISAALGPWFHLSVLPVLGAPLALVAAALYSGRGSPPVPPTELRHMLKRVGGWMALLLVPPIIGDFGSLAGKAAHGRVTAVSFTQALQLLLGTDDWRVAGAMLGLGLVGALALLVTRRRLAMFVGAAAAIQILAIVIMRPVALEFPITVARYGLFLLPVLLLGVALGLRTIGGWLGGVAQPATVVLTAAWLAVSVSAGPLRRVYYAPNNWTNHALFQYYPRPETPGNFYAELAPRRLSPYYQELAKAPAGSLRIVEAPWYYEWHFNSYPFYQQVHHQQMAVGFVSPAGDKLPPAEVAPGDRRLRFRNAVSVLDEPGLCRRHIDRLVLHKDLMAELGRSIDRSFSTEIAASLATWRARHGTPIFEDAQIAVFDVAASCRLEQ